MVVDKYSSVSKFLHWLIAAIVILMLSLSFFLGDVPEKYSDTAYMLHKSLGFSILVLMIFRILWIFHAGKPPLPTAVPFWEKLLSRFVQYSLYILLILMPLSGWIMSTASKYTFYFFKLFPLQLPFVTRNKQLEDLMLQVHNTLAWIIIGLLVLHIVGALKHHFIDKDDVLRSMLPKKK